MKTNTYTLIFDGMIRSSHSVIRGLKSKILKNLLFVLMLLVTSTSVGQVVFTPDGNYDAAEYDGAQIKVIDPNANGTCDINTIYAIVKSDDVSTYLLLGFNNGNGGQATFRYYIDAVPPPSAIGTDFGFPVGEADTVIEFDAKSGVATVEEWNGTTLVPIPSNIVGATGDFNPGDNEFIELKIPLGNTGDVIDLCELEDDGNINLGA